MSEENDFALVSRAPGALEKALPGAKRILSSMVMDTLSNAKKTVSNEIGVSNAQLENWFQTGEKFFHGRGVPMDTSKAVEWYRKAADENYAKAQYWLALCYECGIGMVAKDYVEAVRWYRKAAEQNDTDAQICLGGCYYSGKGVNKNYAEAVRWYRKAAELNDTMAQCCLGDCYSNGEGVPQDFGKAIKWYRKAAEQDVADALGIYYQGYMAVQEYNEKYAKYGIALAQARLGDCYANGQGVPQDFAEAVKLYGNAAEGLSHLECPNVGGLGNTARSLALCYIYGRGVPKDLAEAYMWFMFGVNEEAIDGDAYEELESLLNTMTNDELTEGENRYQRLQQLRKDRFG